MASAFKQAVEQGNSERRQKQKPPEREKRALSRPQFILFFSSGRILELVNFTRTPDGYEITATHGGQAFYPEEIVDRIEPLEQMRVWKDISGRFQIEAAYVVVVNNRVRLKKKDDTIINVSITLLSKDDRILIDAIQESTRHGS